MIDFKWVLSDLQETLRHLAEPGEAQLVYLRSQGNISNDELALDFDAVAPVAPTLQEEGYLTADQVMAIAAVDAQLLAMSGVENAELWTDEAIQNSREWERVRELAIHALQLLEEMGRPD